MKMGWFLYALIAMVSFTFMFLFLTQIGKLGLRAEITLVYYFIVAAVIIAVYGLSSKLQFNVSQYLLLFILLAAIFGAIGNVFLLKSMTSAPNPGYAIAVSGIHIMLVAVISIFLFNAEFTLVKILGVVLSVTGVILLSLK